MVATKQKCTPNVHDDTQKIKKRGGGFKAYHARKSPIHKGTPQVRNDGIKRGTIKYSENK